VRTQRASQVRIEGERDEVVEEGLSMVFPTSVSMRNALPVLVLVLLAGLASLMAGPTAGASAAPATPAVAWQMTDVATPTVLPDVVGKQLRYDAVAENVGGASSEGPFTIRIPMPAGLAVTNLRTEPEASECKEEAGEEVCTFTEPVVPSGFVVMELQFGVSGAVAGVESTASVSGGGAPAPASDRAHVRLGAEHERAPAGIAKYRFDPTGPAGEPVTQAGAHPHFLTTTLLLNNMYLEGGSEPSKPIEATRDLAFYLPLGMLGDPAVTQSCPASIVETKFEQTGCPSSSRVGTILPMILGVVFANSQDPTHERGIYSVQPEKGYAAEFAFASNHLTFFVYASVVRHDGAYMLRVATPGVPQIAYLIGLVATFYGDIQDHFLSGETVTTFDRGAFLSNPMDCQESAQARQASVVLNTWQHPHRLAESEATPGLSSSIPAFASIDGCDLLAFSAGLSVKPETTQADEPSGYEVGLHVPQAPNDPSGLATPPVKNVSVTLPEGTSISPSSANGLQACQATGPEGIDIEGGESEEIAADGLERPAKGHCPVASQIATVSASTPLLHEALAGHLFLAAPRCGGAGQPECTEEDAANGNLFRLYLELEGPESGVVVKLEGHASVNPATGRITADFDEGPQFPFSNLTATLKHGARAPLANSQTCGVASSNAEITPWSSPATPAATPQDSFTVDWSGSGGACPASAPFAPTFLAGTTSPTAATTSPFALALKREDREQNVASLSSTLPEGLLADVAKVAKCPEPQASQASLTACPANSQIGTTSVAVGSGSDPYSVTGKVFFTGPYGGAPFGLSVVVPAAAGPFNLGNVLVRVALFVDPHTAQATAVSGPFPQKLDGVPLRIRTVEVTLDDREFVLNPTSCAPKSITAQVSSTSGATASVSSPFAAAGCNNLAFMPVLSGSTEAKATKANGTGVKIKIAYPPGAEANIARVELAFPKQLPVRLQTLQQACRASTFEANPAACPAGSAVGTAIVHTPILAQPLTGPAYLVSYGSAKFPDVVFVLQGEGVTLDVDGQSFVSHSGVLKVTFASVPDAPFSTFETSLPRGRYSQFTSTKSTAKAEASQCGENLLAPVTMVAQNGAQLTENAKLQVAGCGPSVSIVKARASSRGLALTVRTSAKGRLSVSGPGLQSVVRRNVAAGTHKLTIALTAAGRAAARAHRKAQLTVGLVVGKQKGSTRRKVVL
jgi:hypothetical protein